jgi:hypothetical protein
MSVGVSSVHLVTTLARPVAAESKHWLIGQRVQATVLRSLAPRTAMVAIEGQLLEAHSSIALRPGQRLTLRVEAGGPLPVLKLLGTGDSDSAAEIHARALRLALPRQGLMTPLLEHVRLLGGSKQAMEALPPALSKRIAELQQAVTSFPGLLSANGLRASIVNSGLLLEAKLAKEMPGLKGGKDTHHHDFKAGILRLLAELERFFETTKDTSQEGRQVPRAPAEPAGVHTDAPSPTPSWLRMMRQLGGRAEGALYRIVVGQLRLVLAEPHAEPVWHLELPFFDGQKAGVVVLELDRRRKTRGNVSSDIWSVVLDFELRELGLLQARVRLCGKQLTACLWASRAATAALLNQHLGALRNGLAKTGLTVGTVDCLHGTLDKRADASNARHPLVELEA